MAGRWHGLTRAPGTRQRSPATSGSNDRFDQAVAAFAERYADQNEADYAALKKAVDTGRVTAEVGL